MEKQCCVPECESVSKKLKHRFYLMPRSGKCNQASTQKMTVNRRQKWISSTKCIDLTPKDMFVCQLHFVTGNIYFKLLRCFKVKFCC